MSLLLDFAGLGPQTDGDVEFIGIHRLQAHLDLMIVVCS